MKCISPLIFKLFKALSWTKTSYFLFSGFLAIVILIIVVWWPLAEDYLASYDPSYPFWLQFDWLLLGIFLYMSLMIMAKADIRRDWLTLMIGLVGGLVIEAWGTQTSLWTYYTNERPPLWILPAWPIATLTIDRMVLLLSGISSRLHSSVYSVLYWIAMIGFFGIMFVYTLPTLEKPFTIIALIICATLILSIREKKIPVITFLAGSSLGYFLELWGTTRECWTYYSRETPPMFAVFAHGLAATAFWWTRLIVSTMWTKIIPYFEQLREELQI